MEYTNSGLVTHCKKIATLGTAYMWGSFGQKITQEFIEGRKAQYPDYYSAGRVEHLEKLVNYRGFDCIGLIKSYYWGGYEKPKYLSISDFNCTGMFNRAKVKGLISTLPEKPGLILYKPGHVGVYIGNKKAIEATLSADGKYDGVELTELSHQRWTHWMQCPMIEDDSETDKLQGKITGQLSKSNVKVSHPVLSDDPEPVPQQKQKIPQKPRSARDLAGLNRAKNRM